MEILFLRESVTHRNIDGSRRPTSYLRCVIYWVLSLFGRVLILGSLSAICAFAQTAQISGTITDSSGAVVANATVTTLDNNTGITRPTESNSEGYYMVPLLQPGNYMVTAEASGFTTQVRTGIILDVGSQHVLNIILQVGQVSQTVEVTGAAQTIELASSSIGGLVNETTVVELPLNGRDWTQLATLQPAVNAVLTQDALSGNSPRGNRGFGSELSISGTRPQTNNYLLDGISIVDYSGGSPGSVAGVALGVDAIGEFSVLTSNYDAEYGRTSGGVINAITKSGTNGFHGDAYEFLRNSALDAKNFFDVGKAPEFRRNQFGASAGGPIQKGKTFFFADYEGFRQALGITNVNKVPSSDARNGLMHNSNGTTTQLPFIAGVTNSNGINLNVVPFLSFYPLPNQGLIGTGNTGLFDIATNDAVTENFGTVRVDHKFSDKDSIFGTWSYDSASDLKPDNFDTTLIQSSSLEEMIALEENHIFSPSLINSLRIGYYRVSVVSNASVSAINPLGANMSLGALPGDNAPTISVSGLSTFNGGVGALSSPHHHWNSDQVYDDVFLTKGTHSIKFGFVVEPMQHNTIGGLGAGKFAFGSLTGFLTNQPLTFTSNLPTVHAALGIRQFLFGGYVQDDWRLRHNLTLNLGVRYEVATVPTEIQNRLSNLRTATSLNPQLGSPYFLNPTLRNFEPRVGFSWDPFHDGKTAIRGSFGIFDVLPLNYEFFNSEQGEAPFSEAISLSGASLTAGSFPKISVAPSNLVPANLQFTYIQFNPPRNYVMIWNLNLERQLTSNTSMMVGYVGNHGVHMLNREDDGNSVIPTLTPEGFLFPSPIGSGTRLNPNVGDLRYEYWGGDSEYDALEVQVTKKMSHGFQLQGSYTWGKNIDTGSASDVGDPFTNSVSSLFFFCASCKRGLSDFNIAQTLVANYLWDVPAPKALGAFGSHVLGGWEIGGIITAETGVPITPLIGGDPLGTESTDPRAYPNRLNGPGCASDVNPGNPNNYIKLNCFALPQAPAALAAQCVPFGAPAAPIPGTCANLIGNAGRNSVVGPGLVTWDASLYKNNYIKKFSETFNVQFRVEMFNMLNHPNFATPVDNETLFNSAGQSVGGAGAVDMTSTTNREIQFAVKLIW